MPQIIYFDDSLNSITNKIKLITKNANLNIQLYNCKRVIETKLGELNKFQN